MVSPLYLIIIALGSGFLLPLIGQAKGSRPGANGAASALFYASLVALVAIPASWIVPLFGTGGATEVFTAGFRPPLSINLRMGTVEAIVLTLVNLVGLLSVVRSSSALQERGASSYVLVLILLLGANGLVLTRDLFNAFVFMEILSIGTYGLLALNRTDEQYAAGFKYLIAGGISSVFFLLGTVYLYRLTGTLNIDGMIEILAGANTDAVSSAAVLSAAPDWISSGWLGTILTAGAGFVAPFLLFAGVLIELKPFPANGWGLDAYQAADPGVASMLSAVNATAVVLLLHKLLPIFPDSLVIVLAWVGMLTFVGSNLLGLRQRNPQRMLGYSSVAQIGLVTAVIAFARLDGLAMTTLVVVGGGLLLNHMIAKAGLYWVAGATDHDGGGITKVGDAAPAKSGTGPIVGITAVILALALAGLPPFPGFWAKWQLVNLFLGSGRIAMLVLLLTGSLFEVIYLFRWVGGLIARREGTASADAAPAVSGVEHALPGTTEGPAAVPVRAAMLLLVAMLGAGGVFLGWTLGLNDRVIWAPFFFAAGMLALEWLPSRIKAVIAVAAVAIFTWIAYPLASGIGLIFGALFAGGAIIAIIASIARKQTAFGTYTFFVLAGTSLVGLVTAAEPIAFFVLWELMTIGSYLLVARSGRVRDGVTQLGDGPGAQAAALRYLAFSVGAALLIMTGLVLGSQAWGAVNGAPVAELVGADGYVRLPLLRSAVTDATGPAARTGGLVVEGGLGAWAAGIPASVSTAVFILLGLGFLVKMGAMGVHIWLPDSYGEADDETTTFLSASLSKVGVLGLIMLLVMIGAPVLAGGGSILPVLGWIGGITALLGALSATFQEDIKKLLAYSSISQLGYIVMGLALATHLGWVAGIYQAVNHFIFKSLLFLGMTGVILRSGTRYMYQMGGLIKRMPLTFISVLMAIIAVSGVPPLSGFGAKWLIYSALIESEQYILAGVAFFASTIAFLYLFRLIYTIFLGQLKDNLREVKEAPVWIIGPQLLLMGGLMFVSMFPNAILNPIMAGVDSYIASSVNWENYTVISTLGYWNGNAVMYVTMGVFALPLIWLMLVMRRPQKVKQFNMVFAAERPERPETTHYAHNFFAPYRKALGFLVAPVAVRTWDTVRGGVESVAGALRRLYTGNGQTYALHILLMTVVLYLVAGGL
jgi:formate hydrogenlyase subunit 3/multisubunit Na+/H+ antiporter MnhD subunit